jgi:hypothetical protein
VPYLSQDFYFMLNMQSTDTDEERQTMTLEHGSRPATAKSSVSTVDLDLTPYSLLSNTVDDEQEDLKKLLSEFDPTFKLFSNATSDDGPIHKRRVSFDLPSNESSPKRFHVSPVDEEDQRHERNKLWKQSLKLSMFGKRAPLTGDETD